MNLDRKLRNRSGIVESKDTGKILIRQLLFLHAWFLPVAGEALETSATRAHRGTHEQLNQFSSEKARGL
jgi:hypothetical protein